MERDRQVRARVWAGGTGHLGRCREMCARPGMPFTGQGPGWAAFPVGQGAELVSGAGGLWEVALLWAKKDMGGSQARGGQKSQEGIGVLLW